jgi:hypothetical protein
MIEAFLDPKTWLFALFSAFDNIPNSLTNQRAIIVSSFGFTPLQTTLLGSVDGIIEIFTIWTGVNIAARINNSRAYVGFLYFLPNLLGVVLVNILPWENKIGLLFAVWITGKNPAFQNTHNGSFRSTFRCWNDRFCLILVMAVERHCWAYEAGHHERHHAFCILHRQRSRAIHVASPAFAEVCVSTFIYGNVKTHPLTEGTISRGSSLVSAMPAAWACYSPSDSFFHEKT